MFKLEKWIGKEFVMHCKTKKEAELFCNEMNKIGFKWVWGEKKIGKKNDEWNMYRKDTCYKIIFDHNIIIHGKVQWYEYMGDVTILEYSDYMDK